MSVPPCNQSRHCNYHVMPRGINRHDIFEDDEDYMQFFPKLFDGILHRYLFHF